MRSRRWRRDETEFEIVPPQATQPPIRDPYPRDKAKKRANESDKRVAPGAMKLTPVFGRSLDDAVARLAPESGKTYLVFGDRAFFESGKEALAAKPLPGL